MMNKLCIMALICLILPMEITPKVLVYNQANEEAFLDALGVYFNTDKSSLGHFYTRVYENIFEPYRRQPLKFLEIGISEGGSVNMWNAYFAHPEALLFFIDISDKSLELCHNLKQNFKRIEAFKVDQENREQLLQFVQHVGGNFDIIIDDGGHTMNQQLTSFEVLFPYLKSGGIYVIEDLHTSYWKDFQDGKRELTTVNFLKNLIDQINYVGAKSTCANINKYNQDFENNYQRDIKNISFFCSMCFIYKN